MAENDLSIIVKTKVEVDEAQAQQEIKKFEDKFGSKKNSQIKIPVAVDEQSSRANIQNAVSKLTQSLHSKPVKAIALDVDRVASTKNIKTAISEIQGKLSSQKSSKIKIGIEAPKSGDVKKEIERSIKEAEKAQTKITKASQPRQRDTSRAVNRFKTNTENSLRTLNSRAFNRKNPLTGADADNINNYISQIREKLEEVGDSVSEQTRNEISKLLNQANNALGEIRAKAESATDFRTKDVANQKLVQGNNLNTLIAQLKSAGTLTEEMQENLLDLHNALNNVADSNSLDEYLNLLEVVESRAKTLNAELKFDKSQSSVGAGVAKLKSQLENMKVNWTQALEIPEFKARINEIESMLDSVDNNFDLSQARAALVTLRADIKAVGADCLSFGGQVKSVLSKMSGFVSTADIIMTIRRGITSAVNNVKNLDSAMVELKKVTDLTSSAYDKFLDKAGSRSKDVGTTLVDYVAGTADFARLGYNIQDAQHLSESANILFKVGDDLNSIDDSTDAIIASMKAYGLQVSDVTSIIDQLNAVSNKTSISTGGLADAITRSASALSLSGLSLEKSLALIVAGNEATRDSSMTGNALKTLSMRIRGAKTDLQEAGEEVDEYVNSTSKMREELKALTGVDIMVNDKQFKDLFVIMDEMSTAYKTLSDIDKANVTEILFGKTIICRCA